MKVRSSFSSQERSVRKNEVREAVEADREVVAFADRPMVGQIEFAVVAAGRQGMVRKRITMFGTL